MSTPIETRDHPNFRGNREDLAQFVKLASSRIRSAEREQALRDWEHYKLTRQLAASPSSRRSRGQTLRKGDYIQAMTRQVVDLRGANLDGIIVGYADLRGVLLDGCSLRGAWMKGARFKNASFAGADLSPDDHERDTRLFHADLVGADFTNAKLCRADLSYAMMQEANLTGADVTETNLQNALLVRAKIQDATFVRTRIYGTAVWDVVGTPRAQRDLSIGDVLSVDDLKIAQFIYLIMNNAELRSVIDAMTTKSVLLLGRFSPERKIALEALRNALRARGMVPIIFDFAPSAARDLAETITLLAGLARFVIADLSDPKAVPVELDDIVKSFSSVPVQPIIADGEDVFGMFPKWRRYQWVLPVIKYTNVQDLPALLDEQILPAVQRDEAARRGSQP